MRTPRQDPPKPSERKERLKAALQANIAKRKAQARAKAQSDTARSRDEVDETGETEDE